MRLRHLEFEKTYLSLFVSKDKWVFSNSRFLNRIWYYIGTLYKVCVFGGGSDFRVNNLWLKNDICQNKYRAHLGKNLLLKFFFWFVGRGGTLYKTKYEKSSAVVAMASNFLRPEKTILWCGISQRNLLLELDQVFRIRYHM